MTLAARTCTTCGSVFPQEARRQSVCNDCAANEFCALGHDVVRVEYEQTSTQRRRVVVLRCAACGEVKPTTFVVARKCKVSWNCRACAYKRDAADLERRAAQSARTRQMHAAGTISNAVPFGEYENRAAHSGLRIVSSPDGVTKRNSKVLVECLACGWRGRKGLGRLGRQGGGCPVCNRARLRVGQHEWTVRAAREGWTLLCLVGDSNTTRVRVRCRNGHEREGTLPLILRNPRCAECEGRQRWQVWTVAQVNEWLAENKPHLRHGWDDPGARVPALDKTPFVCELHGPSETAWAKVRSRPEQPTCPECGSEVLRQARSLGRTVATMNAEWAAAGRLYEFDPVHHGPDDPVRVGVTAVRGERAQEPRGHFVCLDPVCPAMRESGEPWRWETSINTVIRQTGCPACGGKVPRPVLRYRELGQTEALRRYIADERDDVALVPGQRFSRMDRHLRWVCPDGHEWRAIPATIIDGTGCPTCAAPGFKPAHPAILYLVVWAGDPTLVKYGITNTHSRDQRMKTHTRGGWDGEQPIAELPHAKGTVVRRAEALLHEATRRYRHPTRDEIGSASGLREAIYLPPNETPHDFVQRMRNALSTAALLDAQEQMEAAIAAGDESAQTDARIELEAAEAAERD